MSTRLERHQHQRRSRLHAHYQTHSRKTPLFILFFVIIVFGIVVFFISHSYLYQYQLKHPLDPTSNKQITFTITKDDSLTSIAQKLESSHLAKASLFTRYITKNILGTKINSGVTVLSAKMTVPEIATALTTVSTADIRLTLPEGWRLTQYAKRISAHDIDSADNFLALTASKKHLPENLLAKLPILNNLPADRSLEGYLFPDTYFFSSKARSLEIVRKSLLTLQKKITPQMQEDIKKSGRTLDQILKMASIIEREAKHTTDRKLISGILWDRFDLQIGLYVDPTILYALGDWNAPLTSKNLRLDSKYNTRKYHGLPPTPICNPSLDSIESAIYPTKSKYMYFLATKNTGEIKYAETLAEHNINKTKYLNL